MPLSEGVTSTDSIRAIRVAEYPRSIIRDVATPVFPRKRDSTGSSTNRRETRSSSRKPVKPAPSTSGPANALPSAGTAIEPVSRPVSVTCRIASGQPVQPILEEPFPGVEPQEVMVPGARQELPCAGKPYGNTIRTGEPKRL